MLYYSNEAAPLRCAAPSTKFVVLGAVASSLGVLLSVAGTVLGQLLESAAIPLQSLLVTQQLLYFVAMALLFVAGIAFICALVAHFALTDADRIRIMVRKALFLPENGNPLCLKTGERIPRVSCLRTGRHSFSLVLQAGSCTAETLSKVSSSISSSLTGQFKGYAVTQTDMDAARNFVDFTIEDVLRDRRLIVSSPSQLLTGQSSLLSVQEGTRIDLSTSGSMLVAGKTRSGKTTGIIALLLQVLDAGPDEYGSRVIIIDPKQAELSRLPHTVTVDSDGGGHAILAALKTFADSITERQRHLNDLSNASGDAVKWWDAGMKVSLLFIDEFVSARTLFPTRASKEEPDYCLAAFDGLLKRIVTMGASAGCYAIVSIAEASVESGGLPAMLRSAMSTKILFRPTLPEARLIWDPERLKDMPERVYGAGDAWFSSTDGIHDRVTYVHFPVMNFPVYAALSRLLSAYYQ